MKSLFSLLLAFGLLLFMLFAPALIASGADRSTYTDAEKRKTLEYRGSIVFWHIVSFKTAENSGYSLIRARCDRFERNAPYVFIKLFGMTPKEAGERLAGGERPDMVSFPQSFDGFSDTDAKPYMFDSYVLTVNTELFKQCGAQLPYGDEMTREAFYTAVAGVGKDLKAVALSSCVGTDAMRALQEECFSEEGDGIFEWVRTDILRGNCAEGTDAFLNASAVMAVCPFSEYAELCRDKRAEQMDIRAYNISGYTDLVQFVGVCSSEDAAKTEMCKRLAASMLSAGFQSQICTLGMFPVMPDERLYEEDYLRTKAFELIADYQQNAALLREDRK